MKYGKYVGICVRNDRNFILEEDVLNRVLQMFSHPNFLFMSAVMNDTRRYSWEKCEMSGTYRTGTKAMNHCSQTKASGKEGKEELYH